MHLIEYTIILHLNYICIYCKSALWRLLDPQIINPDKNCIIKWPYTEFVELMFPARNVDVIESRKVQSLTCC